MQAFAAIDPANMPSSMAAFPRLRVVQGPNAGQSCRVLDHLVIGNGPSCQWALSDPMLAPAQLELQRFSGTLYAKNLGAPGSAGRNGAELGPSNVPLVHGDQLQLGPNTQLVYEESG
jgi:predicted component of type VI protein secretion system